MGITTDPNGVLEPFNHSSTVPLRKDNKTRRVGRCEPAAKQRSKAPRLLKRRTMASAPGGGVAIQCEAHLSFGVLDMGPGPEKTNRILHMLFMYVHVLSGYII